MGHNSKFTRVYTTARVFVLIVYALHTHVLRANDAHKLYAYMSIANKKSISITGIMEVMRVYYT